MNIKEHLEVAEALGELSRQGILVIGSGFATHNLGDVGMPGEPTASWAQEFQTWLHDVFLNKTYSREERKKRLLTCTQTAPHMSTAHPRIEHFLPLAMCCAAAGYKSGELLHSEFVMQTLLNEHYMFSVE